jgi:hypothetical protein
MSSICSETLAQASLLEFQTLEVPSLTGRNLPPFQEQQVRIILGAQTIELE